GIAKRRRVAHETEGIARTARLVTAQRIRDDARKRIDATVHERRIPIGATHGADVRRDRIAEPSSLGVGGRSASRCAELSVDERDTEVVARRVHWRAATVTNASRTALERVRSRRRRTRADRRKQRPESEVDRGARLVRRTGGGEADEVARGALGYLLL